MNAFFFLRSILVGTITILCSHAASAQQQKPQLVVGIVVDQMCYEYLYRYQARFGTNGFTKLMQQGTHCRNTQYNYVPTFTGPGHAAIYTGATPADHGIVANEWYDRTSRSEVNCVGDPNAKTVGSESADGMCSPHRMIANTVTDQLKLTDPQAKVVSVSIKNRGAILPGGHLSDGSYWFDYSCGRMITSSFFQNELPLWVQQFNAQQFPEKFMQQTWNTLYPIQTYTASGPDDSPYEHLLAGKTSPTFPYDLSNVATKKWDVFSYTPFANTFLTDFALQALSVEKLGQTPGHTDFLAISYSTPDIAGHAFGPYSVEIEDMYLRLDREIARLIKELEQQVGKDNFVLFLTADHAVVPVPQYLVDHKLPGGYLFYDAMKDSIRQVSQRQFGCDLLLAIDNNNVYLDWDLMRINKLHADDVTQAFCEILRNWPGVKRVFTAKELEQGTSDDVWYDMVRKGYKHGLSGDLIFLSEPGYLPKSKPSETTHRGTSHGSAFNYDTHVPLIWYGKDIPKQEIFRRINITDIAATLTHILQVQKPNATTGEPITELFIPKKR